MSLSTLSHYIMNGVNHILIPDMCHIISSFFEPLPDAMGLLLTERYMPYMEYQFFTAITKEVLWALLHYNYNVTFQYNPIKNEASIPILYTERGNAFGYVFTDEHGLVLRARVFLDINRQNCEWSYHRSSHFYGFICSGVPVNPCSHCHQEIPHCFRCGRPAFFATGLQESDIFPAPTLTPNDQLYVCSRCYHGFIPENKEHNLRVISTLPNTPVYGCFQ